MNAETSYNNNKKAKTQNCLHNFFTLSIIHTLIPSTCYPLVILRFLFFYISCIEFVVLFLYVKNAVNIRVQHN